MLPRIVLTLPVLVLLALAAPAAAQTMPAPLLVDAPPGLEPDARRVREVSVDRLADALSRAGLAMPPQIRIVLVDEAHPLAPDVPHWIVGLASGRRDIVIFPRRVVRYPYDSLESVVRHEVTHLALTNQADGRPLPRWFHEGVAVSVDAGFGLGSRLRLLFAVRGRPRIEDVERLFVAGAQPDATDAYLLSAALVDDLRRRHGLEVPGAMASRVADGLPFAEAFLRETGVTADAAAALAWGRYTRWIAWVPTLTGTSALWTVILALAVIAYVIRVRQRRRRRHLWDEEDAI